MKYVPAVTLSRITSNRVRTKYNNETANNINGGKV